MATHIEETAADKPARRARLTLDIDRALHTRIRLAAFREGISMREYIERILEEKVPEPAPEEEDELRPMAPDALERLRTTREAISRGRVFSDSNQIVRQMREERSQHLGQL
ncbi:MAG TPA: hypothetical protein VF116_00865 [Ktedonobacterales bacterium]